MGHLREEPGHADSSSLLGGGVRDRLPAYASGGWAPPEQTAEEVLAYQAKGFSAVKIRVGGLDEPHFPQGSLERLRLARHRAPDILQPDVAVVGGLTEARRVAALAHAHGLPVAPHVWGSALLWAASLQLAAAPPNCVIFEFCQAY